MNTQRKGCHKNIAYSGHIAICISDLDKICLPCKLSGGRSALSFLLSPIPKIRHGISTGWYFYREMA